MVIFRQWLLFLATFIFSLTAQAEVAELAISQVDVYLPDIKIYANLLDENKQSLSPDGLLVRVNLDGNQAVFVESPAVFKNTGNGVAYTFLLDVSGSMNGEPYRGAIEAIRGLFNQMNDSDVVAVLTFGDEVRTITNFTRPNQALFDTLRRITPDAQKTHFYKAIQQAFMLNKRRETDLPTRRAILVITDGKDEGSGIRLDDLLDNEFKQQSIPIYSVGFSQLREDKEKFLDELKRISNLSGGAYVRSDAHSGFAEIYTKTFGDIQEQIYIHVRAPEEILADGKPHMLQVVVTDGTGSQISDDKEVFFLYAQVVESANSDEPSDNGFILLPWHYMAMALGGILLLLIIWLTVRKSRVPKMATTSSNATFQAPPPTTRNNDEFFHGQTGWNDTHDEVHTQGFEENLGETQGGAIVGETVSDIDKKSVEEQFVRKIQFIVTDGHDEGLRGSLPVGEKGIIIGRQGPEVAPNIVLIDPKISRPHCLLQAGEDWFSVKNMSQTRSTFVNGIRINDKHVFKDDDCVINIGDTTIRINLLKLN